MSGPVNESSSVVCSASDDLVLRILDEWPDRWRYPDLALALEEPGFDLKTAAVCLLHGLARPQTPVRSVAELVSDGRYDQAEQMLLGLLDAEAPVSAAEWSQAEREVTQARATAARRASQTWADLRARAGAVGLDLVDDPPVAELARNSWSLAQDELDKRASRATEAEQTRRQSIEADLARVLVTTADDQAVRAWADSVRECVTFGEFTVAAQLVANGPGRVTEAGPRTVVVPPMLWPWPDSSVREVLRWYGEPSAGPGPEFVRFRLGADDRRGHGLLHSVGRLAEKVDPPSVRDFAIELAALLGEAVSPQVDEAEGRAGFRTTLFGLADARLPELPILGRKGIALWIGDEEAGADCTPPPGVEPMIWFRPVLVAPRAERSAVAVLDISTLLRVIAPDGGIRGIGPAERRINLLRLVVPRLDPAVVLDSESISLGGGASPRDSLAWLFDLLGLLPDGFVLDSLLYHSGEHPLVLRHLVNAVLRHRSPDDRRISRDDLAAARTADVLEGARHDLLATLDSDSEAKAVLLLTLWGLDGAGVVRADQVLAGLDTADIRQDDADLLRGRLSVDRDLNGLAARALVKPLGGGRFAISPGLCDVLRGNAGPRGLHDDLVAALGEAAQRIKWARQAQASVLAERVIRLIGHRVDNDVIAIATLLDRVDAAVTDQSVRADVAAAIRRVGHLGGGAFVKSYEAALAPPGPVEVHDLIRVVIGDTEWGMAGTHVGNVSTDDRPLWIRVNRFVMHENLRHLVINAFREIARRTTYEPGVIAIEARLVTEPDLRVPTDLSLPLVRLDIDDSGPGFGSAELAYYRELAAGNERPAAPPNGRAGTGLRQATDWLAGYGGRLELPDRSPRLGGARVTIWLPAVPDPTSGETT